MRTLSILTALFFLAGCGTFQFPFQLTATPEPGSPEPTRVAPPAAGKRVEVDVRPGQTVCLDVPSLIGARIVVQNDGLLVVMPNGGEIFLANFRPSEAGLRLALCLVGGLAGITPGAGPGALGDDGNDNGDDGNGGGGGGGGGGGSHGSHDGNRSGQHDDTNPGNTDNDNGGTDNPNNSGNGDDEGSHESSHDSGHDGKGKDKDSDDGDDGDGGKDKDKDKD